MFGDEKWAFLIFNLIVGALLVIDLALFHRRPRGMKIREALVWTGFWVALALAFNALLPWLYDERIGGLGASAHHTQSGSLAAKQFFTGYLIELSLSVDNLFVFLAIFKYFRVDDRHQHRVLFWGIVAAIAMRAVMIFLGVVLIERFHWLMYLLGFFLVMTGIRLAREGAEEIDPSQNLVLRLSQRFLRVARGDHGERFLVREGGRWMATSLTLVLIVVNVTDVVFAMDSIPAVLAITRDPFLVYSSNFLAILGLRSLYFALAGAIGAFDYLKYGLAAVLTFVGLKMILGEWVPISTDLSLIVVAALLGSSVAASVVAARWRGRR